MKKGALSPEKFYFVKAIFFWSIIICNKNSKDFKS